ncbi:multiple epidermal growth factor-like domains protein 10 isoform X1 [Biomphalaria glabrata]|uniref:Multiple epidermal growth factor-like domains protein 10 isoform X1 n=1 Tax=Biomphalaria glabrata TaxID=6526 RepID=A0A9U8ECM1_BIOGL|nr:multiple epidermal growth factor-like domains protein 10 isoform X1 [Biomphalaria glabrata]
MKVFFSGYYMVFRLHWFYFGITLGMCEYGYFGKCYNQCLTNCKSCYSDSCVCLLCKSGYLGQYCTEACRKGMWGEQCKNYCSPNCDSNKRCNVTTGDCLGDCRAGFYGPKCETKCKIGTWGKNCLSNCSPNCDSNQSCDILTGDCLGACKAGYLGPQCQTLCPPGLYGLDCQDNCSENCLHPCDSTDGHCSPCRPGYEGESCQKAVPLRRKEETSNSFNFVHFGIGVASLAVAVAIVFGILVLRRSLLGRRRTRVCNIYNQPDVISSDMNQYVNNQNQSELEEHPYQN